MSLYYFHIRRGGLLIRDPDGTDLPDLPAALVTARLDAQALIAELVRSGQVVEPQAIEVCDHRNRILASITFIDVLKELIRGL